MHILLNLEQINVFKEPFVPKLSRIRFLNNFGQWF